MPYVVVRRNFIENILNFEFKEPLNRGYFYAGYFKLLRIILLKKWYIYIVFLLLDDDNSFKNVIFSGQERKLFIFDMLLFLVVDYFAQNYVLAGFIVYIIYKVN